MDNATVVNCILGSGGNFMAPICQLAGIILSALIYLPFVKLYEKQQAQIEQTA